MADIFTDGTQASLSVLMSAMNNLSSQGQSLLANLETGYVTSLLEFNNLTSAVNSRRSRALRILPAYHLAVFSVSDFYDIDQSYTTATVRADVGAASVLEKSQAPEFEQRSVVFSTNVGVSTELNTDDNTYQVISSTTPNGQYLITLLNAVDISLLIFDTLASPSVDIITVSISLDGSSYTQAYQTQVSGYRTTSWFNTTPAKYIQINITPSAPDNLNGNTYTFGYSGLECRSSFFNRLSTFQTRPVTFNPIGTQVVLNGTVDPNLSYLLSFNGASFQPVQLATPITIPGIVNVVANGVTVNNLGVVAHTLQAGAVLSTLEITETLLVNGVETPVAKTIVQGLNYNSDYQLLTGEYFGVVGNVITIVNSTQTINTSRVFTISYITVPSSMTAVLKVQLSSPDGLTTPLFTGATLEAY